VGTIGIQSEIAVVNDALTDDIQGIRDKLRVQELDVDLRHMELSGI